MIDLAQDLYGSSAPLSIQNNNPGNMRQSGGGFASYDSPQAGIDAMQRDLTLKVSGLSPVMRAQYGNNYEPTLRNVISTWAPSSENDTGNYINFVAKNAGIDPDAPLSVADVPKIMAPMITMEGGKKATQYFGKPLPQQANAGNVSTDAQVDAPPKLDLAAELYGNSGSSAAPDSGEPESQFWARMGNDSSPNFPNVKNEGNILPIKTTYNPDGTVDESHLDWSSPLKTFARGIGDLYRSAENQDTNTTPDAITAMANLPLGMSALRAGASAAGDIGSAALKTAQTLKKPAVAFLEDTFGGGPPLGKEAPSLLRMDEPPPPPGAPPPPPGGASPPPPPPPSGTPLVVSPKAVEATPSKLGEYLAADGIDLNKTADSLEALQKIDPNARAIDAIAQGEGDIPGGTNIKALLKSISQAPGQARTMVAQMIARGRNAGSDVGDWVTQSLGAGDYATQKATLDAQMKGAGAAYDKAYANNIPMTSPAMNDLLARPAGKSALAYADNLAANEGATIRNLDGSLNTRGIDYVKRALDDMISSTGTNQFGKMTQAGKAYTQIKNGILNEADNLNPDFAAARAQFADPASQAQALQDGRNFFNMDKHEITAYMQNKSPVVKGQFINGVSEAVQNKIGAVNDNTNPINRIWNENNRQRFQALFPDQAAYDQFAQGMDLHQVKMGVNQTMAGSPTFQNQAFDTKPVGSAMGNIIRAGSDLPMFIGSKLADFADKALAKSAASLDTDSKTMIARILTSKDPEALRAVARRIPSSTQIH